MGSMTSNLMQSQITINYDDTSLVITTIDFVNDNHHVTVRIEDDTNAWSHTQEPNTSATVVVDKTFTLSRNTEGEMVPSDIRISIGAMS